MTAVDAFKGMFGGNDNNNKNDMGGALNKLESLQNRVARVKSTLQDSSLTQFVVVTIPTSLAVAESKRLVQSLQKENIKVSSILCNQIITDDLGPSYMATRSRAQRRCIDIMNRATVASSGPESDGYSKIEVTEVPYIDTEVTGTQSYFNFFTKLSQQIIVFLLR